MGSAVRDHIWWKHRPSRNIFVDSIHDEEIVFEHVTFYYITSFFNAICYTQIVSILLMKSLPWLSDQFSNLVWRHFRCCRRRIQIFSKMFLVYLSRIAEDISLYWNLLEIFSFSRPTVILPVLPQHMYYFRNLNKPLKLIAFHTRDYL